MVVEHEARPGVPWRTVVGISAIGLIVVGVWGLWGWQWAAIVSGLPVAAFYIYGEIVEVQTRIRADLRQEAD